MGQFNPKKIMPKKTAEERDVVEFREHSLPENLLLWKLV